MDVKYAMCCSVQQPTENQERTILAHGGGNVCGRSERTTRYGHQREKSVRWILLTSHPVASVEDAIRIVQWYTWRWIIEQVFRTMKTEGLNIEASEVETLQGLKVLSTWLVLQPSASCS